VAPCPLPAAQCGDSKVISLPLATMFLVKLFGLLTATAAAFRRQGEIELRGSQKHMLRVCNAYPASDGLTITTKSNEQVTEDGPLAYKACDDYMIGLSPGGSLDFKVGDTKAGTFAVSNLPRTESVLLLVVYRKSPQAAEAAFESHVYASLLNAQLAVIDTYRGSGTAELSITDEATANKPPRSDKLRFDSVVALNEGSYKLVLTQTEQAAAPKQISSAPLTTVNRESYVALRVGMDGTEFPMEIVVYPHPDFDHAGAALTSLMSVVVLMMTQF